jgi:hypothetical protein
MENPQKPQCHVHDFNFLDMNIIVPQQGHGGREPILGISTSQTQNGPTSRRKPDRFAR